MSFWLFLCEPLCVGSIPKAIIQPPPPPSPLSPGKTPGAFLKCLMKFPTMWAYFRLKYPTGWGWKVIVLRLAFKISEHGYEFLYEIITHYITSVQGMWSWTGAKCPGIVGVWGGWWSRFELTDLHQWNSTVSARNIGRLVETCMWKEAIRIIRSFVDVQKGYVGSLLLDSGLEIKIT